jgi:hypothetical protein
MNKTTTKEDLILYAYNESDLKDSDRVQRSIDGDPIIQQDFNEIVETMGIMDEGKVQPSESTIQNILSFAKTIKE